MTISRLAERLLRAHAKKPDTLFYGATALGSMFGDEDLGRLDAAYVELAASGLVRDTGEDMGFFGVRKKLYRITDSGVEHVAHRAPEAVAS